jgi:hypothetical protein
VQDQPGGNRPLLFLDVDGPLIPIGGHHDAIDYRLDRRLTPALARALASNPLLYRLDTRCGRWLAALPCKLVWATTWMADANEVIGPLLGLPELPIVQWPEDTGDDQPEDPRSGRLGCRTPLRLGRRRDHRRRPALG